MSEQSVGGVLPEALAEQLRSLCQGSGVVVREPIFQIAPETFDGIELRRVREEAQQSEIGRESQGPGFVKRAIIEQQEMEADQISSGKMVEEELKVLGIEGRQFQKEALAGQWDDGAVEVETLEVIRRREKWLDAAGRETAAQDRQQTTATFVLDPQAPLSIALRVSAGYARLELGGKRGLELDCVLGSRSRLVS